jgi:hypothetical protein
MKTIPHKDYKGMAIITIVGMIAALALHNWLASAFALLASLVAYDAMKLQNSKEEHGKVQGD